MKATKMRKIGKRSSWLRGRGGYAHYMPYYGLFERAAVLQALLGSCMHGWVRETKGQEERWRGVGCGERSLCPTCGAYRQEVLAWEGAETMMKGMTGLEVGRGVTPSSFGIKVVLTLPKSISEEIDDLLREDAEAWKIEVNRFFKAGYRFIERKFGKGCGGVAGLHMNGETDPVAAHYHLNLYVFPGRRMEDGWYPLGNWFEPAELDEMRELWRDILSKAFKRRLKEQNVNVGYLGKVGQMHAFIRYAMKHQLDDLWAGWQGADGDGVWYRKNRKSETLKIAPASMVKIMERLPVREDHGERQGAGLVPQHFKRIRWFGIFSDGQRSATMKELGLVAEKMAEDDDGTEREGWERSGEVAVFQRFNDDGVVLREYVRDKEGRIEQEMLLMPEGDPIYRAKLGKAFLVPWAQADCRPRGVSIGVRKRWCEPGEQGRDDGSPAVPSLRSSVAP